MKFVPAHFVWSLGSIRYASIIVLALASNIAPVTICVAQTVESVIVEKHITYVQTSATTVVIDPKPQGPGYGGPYGMSIEVNGQNLASITPPVASGPVNPANYCCWNGGQLFYKVGEQGWRLGTTGGGYGSLSMAILNAAFGNGLYTVTVNGVSVPLNLTGDAYPSAPLVTLTGGVWSGGKYVVDPAQTITLTTSAFATYGTHAEDAISVGVQDVGNTQLLHSANPGANSVTFTIPPNTLVAGSEYRGSAYYAAGVDVHPVAAFPASVNAAVYSGETRLIIKAQVPPFPMTVNANIGPTVSNATATFQPRPQDVGTTQSVYVFAVAPSTAVMNASAAKATGLSWAAKGAEADTPVQCLLAQLNSSGQLQAVSASNLAAYVTGTLTAQGQSVNLLNNVATPNIAGTTFYLGYGTSAQQMIASGVNQRALSVASTSVRCDPEAPQTGWWWNTAEGGRGYSIEVAGNHIFYASYLYDVSGRATWLVASGNTSVDGSLFTGNLEAYAQGQTLGGTYHAPNAPTNPGPITLAFSDAQHGAMVWPGGSVPIERFNIVPNGLNLPAQNNQPESGWWWNPTESGRGFFLEWQGGELFMAGYMYDDAGNPIWYLGTNTTPSTNLQSFSANWWQFGNGPTLTGAFKPAQQVNGNVAPVTITFQGSENAIMTLPGGRTTAIRRFRF